MKKQAFNPFLPSYEYIPDGEPRVFNGRVYLYGSHDKFNGISFCLNDYVCWSAPVDDLSDWRYEGVIFRRNQAPKPNKGPLNALYAPDVIQGLDCKFYLYFFLGYQGYIGVARCDEPAGQYEFIDKVRYPDGTALGEKDEPLQFDPGVFVDDDGRVYLYTGFAPYKYPSFLLRGKKAAQKGAMAFELMPDMITIKSGPKYICATKKNSKGSGFEGHEFFEASSMRKFEGKYYFIYSSFLGHELCYAVSDKPDEGFKFGGVLVSNGDIGIYDKAMNYTGNTHGSIAKINDKYYVFYHRQTNRNQFSRQACAEEIIFENGAFKQAELTSCGLNGGPLKGEGEYPANIACHLYSKKGAYFYGVFKRRPGCHPYFTQSGKDREHSPDQYIANFCDGATAGFKYFNMDGANKISIKIRGKAKGVVTVLGNNEEIAQITVLPCKMGGVFSSEMKRIWGKAELSFKFKGKGAFDFISFNLEKIM